MTHAVETASTATFLMRFLLLLGTAAIVTVGVGAINTPVYAAQSMAQHQDAASPVRVSQVNAALREAGLPVTEASQRSFAAGIMKGHYKTFDQLVNAMKWHKAHGKTIAAFGAFTPFDTMPIMLRAKGYLANIDHSNWQVEVKDINVNGHLVYKTFHMTIDTVVEPNMLRGMPVEVEYLPGSNKATKVQLLAAEKAEHHYGPVDCPTCAGASH